MVDISVIEKNALVQTRQSDRPAVGLLKHGWDYQTIRVLGLVPPPLMRTTPKRSYCIPQTYKSFSRAFCCPLSLNIYTPGPAIDLSMFRL